jgi:hypothetical protein
MVTGEALRFDAVCSVMATDLVAVSALLAMTVPVWLSVKVTLDEPVVKPVQGAATELTVNVKVVTVLVRVPVAGEIVSPAGAAGVTTMVCVVRVFFAVTVNVGDAPTWPVAVLHVTPPLMLPTLISELVVACMVPAQTVIANRPPNARALRFLNLDKSMEDLPFPWGIFSTTSPGGGLVFGR